MNASELAQAMLLWETKRRELDALTATIEAEVLKVGKTQVVGSVRASYSAGRKTYDYQAPCAVLEPDLLEPYATPYEVTDWDAVADEVPEVVKRHTTVERHYDYRSMCKAYGMEPIVVSSTSPSVTVKLEE